MRDQPPKRRFTPKQPGVDYDVLDTLLGYAVRRVQLMVTDAFDMAMADHGLTTQRFSALVLVMANPGLKQTELAAIMGIARSGALAIVAVLVRQGLINARAHESDRRAQALFPTEHAVRTMPALIARVQAHDRAVFDALSAADRKMLLGLLEKLLSP